MKYENVINLPIISSMLVRGSEFVASHDQVFQKRKSCSNALHY